MPYIHDLDPIAFSLGPLPIRWYGLMYLIGFLLFLALGKVRARDTWRGMSSQDVDDLLFYGMIGVIVGGRLGHVLFYGPLSYYLAHPLDIFAVWKGGMASHGGIIGVIVAMAVFARVRGKSFLRVADFVVPLVPLGLGAGRIGNFINGELWGRVTSPTLPWAVVFPGAGDGLPRHPSQIYQFLLEGVLLFAILWIYSRKPRAAGTVGSLFLIFYGLLRIVGEVYRQPEALYGYMPLGMSAGQWLSVPMVVIGVVCFVYLRRNKVTP
ncbi:MAG: prolipoprotein diacylglyceryl transferase [Burkholderiaceae bacterium]|nr:prolipoprotein diacylglyceryl transferase [Burkholderiaceae bacterium]